MAKQYVQHISGQGEKWEVVCERSDEWVVWRPGKKDMHYIPVSEYRLCPAPEVWRDVTEECEVEQGAIYHKGERMYWDNGYRPCKVLVRERGGVWAIIIEQKVE